MYSLYFLSVVHFIQRSSWVHTSKIVCTYCTRMVHSCSCVSKSWVHTYKRVCTNCTTEYIMYFFLQGTYLQKGMYPLYHKVHIGVSFALGCILVKKCVPITPQGVKILFILGKQSERMYLLHDMQKSLFFQGTYFQKGTYSLHREVYPHFRFSRYQVHIYKRVCTYSPKGESSLSLSRQRVHTHKRVCT